jgi:hypothetical protein
MLNIIFTIETSRANVIAFDRTFVTFEEFKLRIGVNIRHELIVEDMDTEINHSLDLSRMMLELAAINGITSWEDLEDFLTVTMLTLFKTNPIVPPHMYTKSGNKTLTLPTPISTSPNTGPIVVSTAHQLSMSTEYGSRLTPEIRNQPELKSTLTDLIFVHNNPADPIVDFENCIPVVSGKVHFPVPFGNELFAVDGTKVLKSQSETSEANILIDFSPLGGMETIRFSDCTEYAIESGFAYDLPAGKTLTGKTFILVIAGRFFFDYECNKLSETTIAFNPNEFNLRNIQLSNKTLLSAHVPNTGTVLIPNGDYMDTIQSEDNYESFIILIDNPNIALPKMKPLYDIATPDNDGVSRMFRFPQNAGGLLFRVMTREVIDYFRQFDTDTTIVTISRAVTLNRITVEDPEKSDYGIGYKIAKGNPLKEHSINQEDDGYVLIDIISTEVPE